MKHRWRTRLTKSEAGELDALERAMALLRAARGVMGRRRRRLQQTALMRSINSQPHRRRA